MFVLYDVLEFGLDLIGLNVMSKIEELFKIFKFFVWCIINGEKVWRIGLEVCCFLCYMMYNVFLICYFYYWKLVEEGFVDWFVDWVCLNWKDILVKDNLEWLECVEDFFGDLVVFYKMYLKIVFDVNKWFLVIKKILFDNWYYIKLFILKILDSVLFDDIIDYWGVVFILFFVCCNEIFGIKRKRDDYGGEDWNKKLRKYDDK